MDLGFQGDFRFLGFEYGRHPFDIVWANDFNRSACETYRNNIGGHIHCGDIWDLLPTIPQTADVVIGGFPCQDISINGKGRGVDGSRSGLYRAMVEAVDLIKPKVFVAENVKGLLMKHNKESLDRVLSDFAALGYSVSFQLYSASHYGVPQSRERVIIVGTIPDAGRFCPPRPVTAHKQITALQAIGDLEHLSMDTRFSHIWSEAAPSSDQGQRRLKAERPGYTVRAECHGNSHFHYKLDRRISMREAARLQSFPDQFLFASKLRETERQIGNAVPPVFAWHIAGAVLDTLAGTVRQADQRELFA